MPLELDPDFYANRCLQLASCGVTDLAVAQAEIMFTHMPKITHVPFKAKNNIRSQRLKIAWLTGDCTNHPVARFLLGIFSASDSSFIHNHTLISTVDHRDSSWINFFDQLENLKTYGFNESDSPQQRLSYLRSQQYDIAVDLSGLTGGNSLQLFRDRFATVQVNYLGYFGSTGLNSIDFGLVIICFFRIPALRGILKQFIVYPAHLLHGNLFQKCLNIMLLLVKLHKVQ